MRVKLFTGLLLALAVGACPYLASLESAATAEKHSCCPAPSDNAQGADRCLRAAMPASVSMAATQFSVIGLVQAAPEVILASEKAWLDSASLSPPDTPPLLSRSSRAPPSFLA